MGHDNFFSSCYNINQFQNKTVAEENLSKRDLYNVGYKTMEICSQLTDMCLNYNTVL